MNQESFLLKWKFYEKSLSATLETDITDNNFADVTLLSDDLSPFKVHKFVLSACSPVLKEILLKNPHSSPMIYLNGVKTQVLRTLLQLTYFGQATLYQNSIEPFLKVVEAFQLKDFQIPLLNTKTQKKCPSLPKKAGKTNRKNMLSKSLVETNEDVCGGQENSLPVYKCEDCQSKFEHIWVLNRHKKSIHEGIRYECDKCDYMATQQSNLKRHQRNKHSIDSLSF